MITTDIFIFLEFLGVIDVSWWWIIFFLFKDWAYWRLIKKAVGIKK